MTALRTAGTDAPTTAATLPERLRLGTRRSLLARTQSQWVADRLGEALSIAVPDRSIKVELVEVTTHGDVSKAPLSGLGGTGVFVSALREALLDDRIDCAVHSLKDLPTAAAAGLVLAAVPTREDPRDALVARDGLRLAGLPRAARIGTGSPRRAAQLRSLGLGLDVVDVRGNVDTRMRLVTDGRLDAVVLARAGLLRIGRAHEATEVFGVDIMLPAPGQGALAVEARAGDTALNAALALLDDASTRAAVLAERALLARLEAGCAAPVGALAEVAGRELRLQAVVGSLDGAVSLRRTAAVRLPAPGPERAAAATSQPLPAVDAALRLGRTLAEQMLDDGAAQLIPGPDPTPLPLPSAGPAVTAGEGDS